MSESTSARAFILRHAEPASPFLCPELVLHMITPDRPLWWAGDEEVEALGCGEPFWAFAWPGGQALARHLLDHPELVAERSVLDFGAGSGIVGIAAAMAGATWVRASDIDPLAVEAMRLNARANGVSLEVTDQDLIDGDADADVVLVGDMAYDQQLTDRIVAWLTRLAAQGTTVLLGDPGRGFLPLERVETLGSYRAPLDLSHGGEHVRETYVYRLK